ncbi:MAG: hypothetical protein K8U03_00645 [Planctomycetia bacterium]|nr:hypothetical protein [Planctomycetia bacterium]
MAQLIVWELQGLRPFLPPDFPTSEAAGEELLERVEREPLQFLDLKSAILSRKLAQFWLDGFSRFASSSLEADIHLGDLDEDTLVEAVAQLTWKLRHRGGVSSSQEIQ